jgi:hypothetical protein
LSTKKGCESRPRLERAQADCSEIGIGDKEACKEDAVFERERNGIISQEGRYRQQKKKMFMGCDCCSEDKVRRGCADEVAANRVKKD